MFNSTQKQSQVSSKRRKPQALDSDEEVSYSELSLDSEEIKKTGRWSPAEDSLLRKYVSSLGERNWQKIADRIDGRTPIQCLHRWTKILKPGLIKGPWTKEEDTKLIEWVQREGATKWAQAANMIKGRSGKQIRERWFNHLDPRLKRGVWNPEEDELIFKLYQQYGSSWSKIAKLVPGRPENSIKNRFYSTLRRIASDRRKQLRESTKPPKTKKVEDPDSFLEGTGENNGFDEERSTLYRLLENNVITMSDNVSESELLAETGDEGDYHQVIKVDGEIYLVKRLTDLPSKAEDKEKENIKLLEEIDRSIKENMITKKFDKVHAHESQPVPHEEDIGKLNDEIFDYCRENINSISKKYTTLKQDTHTNHHTNLVSPKAKNAEQVGKLIQTMEKRFNETQHHHHHDKLFELDLNDTFGSPCWEDKQMGSLFQNLSSLERLLTTTKHELVKLENSYSKPSTPVDQDDIWFNDDKFGDFAKKRKTE